MERIAALSTTGVLALAAALLGVEAEHPATPSPYGQFLYIRHNEVDGSAKTDTLMLASVGPDGFQKRDLYTKGNLHVGWRSLGVFGGKVYGLKIHNLLEVDIATGQAENLCSTVQASGYCDGVLAGVVYPEPGKPVLRVFDFRKGAYRDVKWPAVEGWIDRIELSPDHKRVAFFSGKRLDGKALPSMSAMLTFVELANGEVTQPADPVRYLPPAISSTIRTGPPYLWTDPRTILCLRTEVPDENVDGSTFMLDGTVNKVVTIDAITGKLRDVAAMPGRPDFTMVRLVRQSFESVPLWILHGPRLAGSRYRVDLTAGKLVEDDDIGGSFRIREAGGPRGPRSERDRQLFCGETLLDSSVRDIHTSVSPDGRRAVWFTGRGSNQKLRYFDAGEGSVRTVATGWFASGWYGERDTFCWFKDETLQPAAEAVKLAAGWTPFASRPEPKPRPREPDTRKNIADFLAVDVSIDKQVYRRHEPIQVTLTLRNKTDESVEIVRPALFDDRLVRVTLDYPGGSKLVSQIWSYLPEHEKITLEPGESVRSEGKLEVEPVGRYELRADLHGMVVRGNWRGRLRAEPATFGVESSPQDKELFLKKFRRLMATFRGEFEVNPDWDGANETLQDDVTAMGPKVASLLIEEIEKTEDPRARELMLRPLVSLANPEALDFFAAMLDRAEEPETVCRGLYGLYHEGRNEEEALSVLIRVGMAHDKADVRRATADCLARIDDPKVKARFGSAVEDSDEEVRMTAARYLAAAERLDLAAWLAIAADQPTHARYLAARSVIGELEKTWHTNKGSLPEAPWEKAEADEDILSQFRNVVRAWASWAQENSRTSARFFDRDRRDWQG